MKIPSWLISVILKTLGVSEKMDKIREALAGKKTYLTALGMIVAALIQYSADGNLGELVNQILVAVGFMTVRNSIPK